MTAVSVLLPNYNAGAFLRPAIDSILGQTFRDLELIVIDDASTDGSAEIVGTYSDPRLRFIRHDTNRGLPATLNEGLAAASAPLVARQDCDDISHPDRLARQLEAFEREPALALVGTRADLIDERGDRVGIVDRCLEPTSIRWFGILDNPFIHSSVLFRADVVRDRLRGYDERRRHAEDFDLWSRLVREHRARNLPERLIRYRRRASSMMGEADAAQGTGARRADFELAVRETIAANVRATCGPDVPDADAALLAGFILGIDRHALDAFLDAFMRLLAAFRSRHGAEREDEDFMWTLARQFDAIAYRVQPPSRLASLRVFARALEAAPRVAGRLLNARSLALVTVGREARRRAGAARASGGAK